MEELASYYLQATLHRATRLVSKDVKYVLSKTRQTKQLIVSRNNHFLSRD